MLTLNAILSTGFALQAPLRVAPITAARSANVALAASPEVQTAFGLVMLLSVAPPLLPQPPLKDGSKQSTPRFGRQPKSSSSKGRTSTLKLCEPPTEEAAPVPTAARTSFDAAEEKALRKVRLDFGGYPAGPYYTMEKEKGPDAAYAQVRVDHPVLSGWSDGEIKNTVADLKTTPAELLIYSPIGPFLVLSAIAIWRDGLAAWNIPPCASYSSICPPGIGF